MSFANPLLLLGLVGALLPILIHLIHKRRPRRQRFAAIELVLQSVERIQRRWRLRRIILLASRVLLLAALSLAAAGPLLGAVDELVTASSGPTRIAIVVDGSMSMRARYDGTSAFARAVTSARNLVDAMGPEDQAVLVLAARRPQLLVERPTPDKALLYRKLDELEASYGHADVGEAISMATQALGSLSADEQPVEGEAPKISARVVALTDLAEPAFGATADLALPGTSQRAKLELVDVLEGISADKRVNNAITSVETLNVPGEAPRTIEVRARIQSYAKESGGPEPRDITLRQGDEDLVAGSVELVSGTIVDKVMRHAFDKPGRRAVQVALERDVLGEDDIRWSVADVRRQVRMLIVDGAPSGVPKEDEIFYLERALQAGAADQPAPRVITADDLSRADLGAYDVVILAGVTAFARSDGARLSDFVERGGGLLISASEDLDTELYNAELGRVLPRLLRGLKVVDPEAGVGSGGIVALANPTTEHPTMEMFAGDSLGGLLSTRTSAYLLLQPGSERPMTTLVEHDDGQPAIVIAQAKQGRVGLLTMSVDRDLSDFAIRPAFVPLMRQMILYLGQALGRPDTRRTIVGEPRVLNVPRGAMALRVTGPDGEETIWEQSELVTAQVQHTKTELPGDYVVEASFTGNFEPLEAERFVVNADTRESNLRPLSIDEATAVLLGTAEGATDGEASALARARALTGSLSPEALAGLLLLAMVLAFFVESAITAQRIGR